MCRTVRYGGLHDLVAQGGYSFADGTVGRIYKSAPTIFVNYMARSGYGFAEWYVRVVIVNLVVQMQLARGGRGRYGIHFAHLKFCGAMN